MMPPHLFLHYAGPHQRTPCGTSSLRTALASQHVCRNRTRKQPPLKRAFLQKMISLSSFEVNLVSFFLDLSCWRLVWSRSMRGMPGELRRRRRQTRQVRNCSCGSPFRLVQIQQVQPTLLSARRVTLFGPDRKKWAEWGEFMATRDTSLATHTCFRRKRVKMSVSDPPVLCDQGSTEKLPVLCGMRRIWSTNTPADLFRRRPAR